MTQPPQTVVQVPTTPPSLLVPASDSSIQETNDNLQALLTLLGSPAQEGTIASVLQQLANFGAQPWVPNVLNAPILEAAPGIPTIITPTQGYRVWGGYVYMTVRTNNTYTGTDDFYAKMVVGDVSNPLLVVSHVELSVAGPSQHDSGGLFVSIPGNPVAAGTPLKIDVNGSTGLGTTGVIRASGNIFYSIP